jgi:predicted peptidase
MKKLCLLFFLSCCVSLQAQDLSAYQKSTYTNSSGQVLHYRILFPENYDRTKKYPLILFLHGSGEKGNDNEKQLTHGAKLFLKEENRGQFPCIVIFPQCPATDSWNSVIADRTQKPTLFAFDYSRNATSALTSAIEVVKKTGAEEGIDPARIYIAGLSMGGMGTFEAVYRYPEVFAAALPICGGGDATHYDTRISKTAFWVFHGDQDGAVDIKNSRIMVDRLKELKAEVKYTEYPGVNHNSWDNAFAEPELLSWLFSHQRK